MGNAGTKVQAIPATSAVLSAKADGEKRGLESPSGSNSGTVWDEEDICWEESPSSAKVGREMNARGGEVVVWRKARESANMCERKLNRRNSQPFTACFSSEGPSVTNNTKVSVYAVIVCYASVELTHSCPTSSTSPLPLK